MAISLANALARPKLAQTLDVPVSVTVLNPTEVDGTDSFTLYVQLDDIEPETSTETCTGTNGQFTLTVTSAPHSIRVGDVVTGTGIAASSTVTVVSGNTITLNNALTDAVNGNITFNPPTTDAKLIGLQGNFTMSGTTLSLRLRGYAADGTTTHGPTDSTTVAGMGSPTVDQTIRVNLDSFLTNARVPRVNS